MGVQIPQEEEAIFGGCPPHRKACKVFAAVWAIDIQFGGWVTLAHLRNVGLSEANPFAAWRGDETTMQPCVKIIPPLVWSNALLFTEADAWDTANNTGSQLTTAYLELVSRVERYFKDFPVHGALSHDVTVREFSET